MHIGRTIENGVTKDEIGEMLTHPALNVDWPAAEPSTRIANNVTTGDGKWILAIIPHSSR
jgi:alkylhydroperoxidase/carboxymuconolactone decarboxylase family protein YurZ